ncbi:unnamed protein product [Symbiodinium sp. KB8]|nr:unnamed protein product [Symbiodinium sp. KB8]
MTGRVRDALNLQQGVSFVGRLRFISPLTEPHPIRTRHHAQCASKPIGQPSVRGRKGGEAQAGWSEPDSQLSGQSTVSRSHGGSVASLIRFGPFEAPPAVASKGLFLGSGVEGFCAFAVPAPPYSILVHSVSEPLTTEGRRVPAFGSPSDSSSPTGSPGGASSPGTALTEPPAADPADVLTAVPMAEPKAEPKEDPKEEPALKAGKEDDGSKTPSSAVEELSTGTRKTLSEKDAAGFAKRLTEWAKDRDKRRHDLHEQARSQAGSAPL